MKIVTISPFFLLLFLIGEGCRPPKQKHVENNVSIERDIPVNKKGDTSWYFKVIHNYLLGDLQLPELRNGFDSLQIRIWYGGYKENEQRIFVIKKQTDWSAIIYRTIYNPELQSVKSEFINTSPRSGWNTFLEKLIDLEILNHPDYSSIENYPGCTHSEEDVTIEIATINKYRIYSFHCVRGNPSPVLNKVNKIFSFISSEFQRDIRN